MVTYTGNIRVSASSSRLWLPSSMLILEKPHGNVLQFSWVGTKEEIEELADLFCDYSTLPSSSAYVERCFSIEKRIIKTKMNIGNK